MKCDHCGYDDKGTGDLSHMCPKFNNEQLLYFPNKRPGINSPESATAAASPAQPAQQGERELFEAWMVNEAKIIVGSTDPYPAGLERDYWRVWQAARSAPRPVLTEEDAAHLLATLYDHGNGKYRGAVSKAQREKAIAIIERAAREGGGKP